MEDQPNQPPVADAGGKYKAREGEALRLDASGSIDPDGTIVEYRWQPKKPFADHTKRRAKVRFDQDGRREITLTVTDDAGATSEDSAIVRVRNVAPEVELSAPDAPIVAGDELRLDGIRFTDAGRFDAHTVRIDWGDGSTSEAEVSEADGKGRASGAHVYEAVGDVRITVTVADGDGGETEASLDVSIAPPAE